MVDATAEPDPYPRRRDTVATFLAARSTVLGDLYRYASALLEDRRPEAGSIWRRTWAGSS